MSVSLISVMAVALGGALGAVGRYLLGLAVRQSLGQPAFWATLLVNLLGAALLGVLVGWFSQGARLHPAPALLLLTTGFCGGFTTFSTYSLEVVELLQQGSWATGLAYALGSLLGGLLAAALGFWLGRRL